MNNHIKKITSVFCAAALLTTASACSNSGSNNTSTPAAPTTPASQLSSESSVDNTALRKQDASAINNGLKTVYAGVVAGTIAKGSKTVSGTVINWGPDMGASNRDRKEAADAVTIEQAQEYNGTNIDLANLYFVKADDTANSLTKGTIVYWDGQDSTLPVSDKNNLSGPVTNSTTLGELYSS